MKDKIKILDRLEDEAIDMLDNFKQHPIKSLIISLFVIWCVKKIYNLVVGE